MRELIDIAAIYLALAAGFAAMWLGVYSGADITDSIVRALLCCAGGLALGAVAKIIWVIAAVLGGGRSTLEGAKERSEETLEGEIQGE